MTEAVSTNAGVRNARRVAYGLVSSDAMDKSITVRVERIFQHPKYKKFIRKHSKVHAHDEQNEARVGDRVELMECRPVSKTKRWRLVRIVERAALAAGTVRPTEVQAGAVSEAMGVEETEDQGGGAPSPGGDA